MLSLRFGSLASVVASLAVLGPVACASRSGTPSGAGGGAGTSSGGAGGRGGGGGAGSGGGGSASGGAGAGTGGSAGGSAGGGGASGGAGGSSGSGQGGAAAGSGGVSGSDAGEGGDGGGTTDDRPVLERPVRKEYSCAVTTPLANRGAGWTGGQLAATTGGAFLAWERPATSSTEDTVLLSPVDQTGALGLQPKTISTYEGAAASRPRLVASPRGMSLAWLETGTDYVPELRVAEVDTTGELTLMPTTVTGLEERVLDPVLAVTEEGNALLFLHDAADTSSHARFARLDANAAVVGDAVDLHTAGDGPPPVIGGLVATPSGFAATYTPSGSETLLAFLAEDGSRQGDPVTLGASYLPTHGQSLLVRGNELVVAFVGEEGSFSDSDIAGFVSLARFDLTTRALAAPIVRVQTPTVGQETVHPVLFSVGEDIGLLWSRGSVIYVCGGCMPDNHLEAVVMDGDDLTPLTEMLTLPNYEPMGGYIQPMVAPVAGHFAVATRLQFHISAALATGAFQCTPVP